MKKTLVLTLAIASLLATTTPALATEQSNRDRLNAAKNKQNERKENLKDLRETGLARASDRFTDFYTRMEKLGMRIEQIITRIGASASVDQTLVAKAKAALETYKAKLAIAKEKVAAFTATASTAPATNATGTIAAEINTKRKEARTAINEAHKALKDTISATRTAINSAKPVRGTNATTTATSTSSN